MRARPSGRKPKRQTDMRKIRRILTIGAMLLSGSLCAQHYIGVRGGWGGGSSRLVPARETGTEWGLYSGGLSYKFYTDSKFVGGIQADLQYMGRGYMYDQFRDADTSYHRTVNSLELPFMWQPHFYILRRHARVYLNLGVYMSYHLNSEYYWKSKREGIYHRDEYARQPLGLRTLRRGRHQRVHPPFRSGFRGALLLRLFGHSEKQDQISRQSVAFAAR